MKKIFEPMVRVIRMDASDIITTSQQQTERVQFGVWVENQERDQTDIFL